MGQKTNPSALRLYFKSENSKTRKKAALNFGANFHAHNFSKKLQLQLQLVKILEEIFTKSGFILADFKILQTQQKLKIFLSLYLRKNTAKQEYFNFESKDSTNIIEKSRRLHWTARELVWQEMSLNFIENLSHFCENFLFHSKNQKNFSENLEFAPSFQILQPDSASIAALDSQLRNFQKYPFYSDAIQILAIIANENANTGNAELLAKFLSIELFSLNNPQTLLDFLENAFSILLPEASLNNQSQNLLKFIEDSEFKLSPEEELAKKSQASEFPQENYKKSSKLRGLKIQVKGALAAADRATALKFQIGSIPLNTLKANIDYAFQEVKAKRGLLSLRVWLHFLLSFTFTFTLRLLKRQFLEKNRKNKIKRCY